MTPVSEMSGEDLELERPRIREEHDRAWTEYRRALSSTVHIHRFIHDGEMKDMLEKLDHAARAKEAGKRDRRRTQEAKTKGVRFGLLEAALLQKRGGSGHPFTASR